MWLWPPHASSTVFADMMGENEVIKYLISENWENWNVVREREEGAKEKSIGLELVNVTRKEAELCFEHARAMNHQGNIYFLGIVKFWNDVQRTWITANMCSSTVSHVDFYRIFFGFSVDKYFSPFSPWIVFAFFNRKSTTSGNSLPIEVYKRLSVLFFKAFELIKRK